jgi:hypothetical protein
MANSKGNILVAFYSRDGSVESLAKAVAEGAREAGAEVRLRRVPDIVVPPAVMVHVPGWEYRSKRMFRRRKSISFTTDISCGDGSRSSIRREMCWALG